MNADATVYVVDDDMAVRDSLQWLLESVGYRVETYSSAGEFLENYSEYQTGCLIVDVRMPGLSGLELQEELSARRARLPVIIITGHGDVQMAVRAMKAGAVDFIEKPFNDQELLERIHHFIEQDANNREQRKLHMDVMERLEQLTRRERQVLNRVIDGKVNRTIAGELGISIKTVEAHRANVMEKMGADSLAELVTLCVSCDLDTG